MTQIPQVSPYISSNENRYCPCATQAVLLALFFCFAAPLAQQLSAAVADNNSRSYGGLFVVVVVVPA